jgi:cytochrome c oxidase cbb3-type subunit 3
MRFLAATALVLLLLGGIAYKLAPSRPPMDPEAQAPDQVVDFDVLYRQNCSGCHGNNGKGGPATALGDPAYLALADDATIRRVTAEGVAGASMPAFAQSAGGMLTDKQIDVLVSGMRSRWSNPQALKGLNPPPYSALAAGDSSRGASVYATYCASCHGPNGGGGAKASSIVDGSFLALVSEQGLRTSIILGRPELGFPDWRNDVPGRPMSAQDISDVVTWMVAQKPKFPGKPYSPSSKAGESK